MSILVGNPEDRFSRDEAQLYFQMMYLVNNCSDLKSVFGI